MVNGEAGKTHFWNNKVKERIESLTLNGKKYTTIYMSLYGISDLEEISKKIFLEVRKSNIPAINLYIKCGFIEIREIVEYYSNPKENGIMMLKEVI